MALSEALDLIKGRAGVLLEIKKFRKHLDALAE